VLALILPIDRSWAAPAKATTRLITLGTRSGPNPTVARAQTSNLLIVNGMLYVIDAGDGVVRRLTRAGIPIRNIDNIFITHAHSDHTGGLPSLLQVEYDANRIAKVDVYGPPGTGRLVDGLVQYLDVNSEIRISDGTHTIPVRQMVVGHDSGTGTIYRDRNVTVKAVENTHFHFPPSSPAYGKYKSYSYRFETPDRAIVFTGDTGPSDAVTELARGADILVSEVTSPDEAKDRRIKNGDWQRLSAAEQANFMRHMIEEHLTTDEIGTMAVRAGVKKVVLTHLTATANANDDYQRYVAEVKKRFFGEVVIAKDLMQF